MARIFPTRRQRIIAPTWPTLRLPVLRSVLQITLQPRTPRIPIQPRIPQIPPQIPVLRVILQPRTPRMRLRLRAPAAQHPTAQPLQLAPLRLLVHPQRAMVLLGHSIRLRASLQPTPQTHRGAGSVPRSELCCTQCSPVSTATLFPTTAALHSPTSPPSRRSGKISVYVVLVLSPPTT